jgi:hypothetical protein
LEKTGSGETSRSCGSWLNFFLVTTIAITTLFACTNDNLLGGLPEKGEDENASDTQDTELPVPEEIEDSGIYYISQDSDLSKFTAYPGGVFVLYRNITVPASALTDVPFTGSLVGTLNSRGRPCTINLAGGEPLFQTCQGAWVENITVSVNKAAVFSGQYAGAIAGSAADTGFLNITVEGGITTKYPGAETHYAGGIAGMIDADSLVEKCVSNAAIDAQHSGGTVSAGGIAGLNAGTITASYAGGVVEASGDATFAGGIAGNNTGAIDNCAAGMIRLATDSGGSIRRITGENTGDLTNNIAHRDMECNGLPLGIEGALDDADGLSVDQNRITVFLRDSVGW